MVGWNVLRPPKGSILEILRSDGRFSILLNALILSREMSTINSTGPITLFAPTNNAWRKTPVDKLFDLFRDKRKLKDIVRYHILYGSVYYCGINRIIAPRTLNGRTLRVVPRGKKTLQVNYARTIETDISATNGVIHIIDHAVMYLYRQTLPSG